MNRVFFSGNLGGDPEIKTLPNDAKVAKFSLAVNKRTKDQNGNVVESTIWIACEAWNRLATAANDYLKKGSNITVEGEWVVEKWEDSTGKKIKYICKVSNIEFHGKKPDSEDSAF